MKGTTLQRYVLVGTVLVGGTLLGATAGAQAESGGAEGAPATTTEAEAQVAAQDEAPVEGAAPDAVGDWSGSVALLTDYAYRGVSQTLEEPALQGELRWTHEVGFYVAAWASNVDFVHSHLPDDGADIEIDWLAGISRPIGESSSWGVGLTYYTYPGTADGIEYDFLELNLSYAYRWLTFGLNVSDDVIASGETGVDYVVAGAFPLGGKFSLGATVAYWDLDEALGDGYLRWEARIARELRGVVLSLGYHDTDSTGEELFGDNAGGRLILGISRAF
jgi:uncharacterized protein (TIGR02001 family)